MMELSALGSEGAQSNSNDRLANSAPTEHVRRHRFGPGTRFSSVRTLSPAELQKGSSSYYNYNSLAFGQVVRVDDDDFLGQSSRFEGLRSGSMADLETGSKKSDVPETKIQITTVGIKQSKANTKTEKGSKSGGESRLKTIILEQKWFSVYKRLHLTTLILNLLGLLLANAGYFPYAKSNAVVFSLGNIFMCVLVRNEVFLRILFWLAVHLLGYSWIPLKVKTMTTSLLQSVGGIHSGCGMGAIFWLVYAIDLAFHDPHTASVAMLGVAIGILVLLVFSTLAAVPVLRHIHHNLFERVHRFAGWASLGLVWVYVVHGAFWDRDTASYRISNYSSKELAKMQGLWLTVATTVMIILPWLSVRRVAVETFVPATRLHALVTFQGGVTAGLLARISPSPFSEWHAFGIVSDGQNKHTIVAGAVGDFTKSLVESPPTHIWVRTFHFAGIPYLAKMYRKSLLVATGSGIGVFMSFALQATKTDAHLIWIAKNFRESYGDELLEAIKSAPSHRVTLIDTALTGRPKTRELVIAKAHEWKAEVVIVTSNPSCTNDVVNGCKAAGIPAFGPIWDS